MRRSELFEIGIGQHLISLDFDRLSSADPGWHPNDRTVKLFPLDDSIANPADRLIANSAGLAHATQRGCLGDRVQRFSHPRDSSEKNLGMTPLSYIGWVILRDRCCTGEQQRKTNRLAGRRNSELVDHRFRRTRGIVRPDRIWLSAPAGASDSPFPPPADRRLVLGAVRAKGLNKA